MIKGLSGGEKRRLSVVCAALAYPAILFLDGTYTTTGRTGGSSIIVGTLLPVVLLVVRSAGYTLP